MKRKISPIVLTAFCLIALGLMLLGCKKPIYGCTDATAINHSTYATVDDGSCIFEYVQIFSTTASSWAVDGVCQKASFSWTALTQDVIDNSVVQFYIKDGNSWIGLPLTFYVSGSYSSSIEVDYYLNGFDIIWCDSDLSLAANPDAITFKAVIID